MPEPIRILDNEGDILLVRQETNGEVSLVAIQRADMAILQFGRHEAERLANWLNEYLSASKQATG